MRLLAITVTLIASSLAFAPLLYGQGATPQAKADAQQVLSDADKALIIQRLIRRVEDFYVLQDDAPVIAAEIKAKHLRNDYRELADARQFAGQLTLDLRTLSQDGHFGIIYDPQTFRSMKSQLGALDGPNSRQTMREWLDDDQTLPNLPNLAGDMRQNFYFQKLEILVGNVGYLRLEGVPPLEPAKPTVDAAMALLAHSEAIILDLRGNPGGVGGFIPYLISYFLSDGGIHLYSRVFEAVEFSSAYSTVASLPGKRLDQLPLYVLIDSSTGSAARNLAYTLQSFERATLIGEATGDKGYRGAHSASLLPLAEGFLAAIPIGRVVNAKTNTNWRESGVQPDLPVDSKEALEAAHELALQTLIADSGDVASKQRFEQALQQVADARTAVPLSAAEIADLAEFVGTYGVRTIGLDDGKLTYTREGMGATLGMKKIDNDHFALVLPANARSASVPTIRFSRDDQGRVNGFTLINADGSNGDSAAKEG